MLALVCSWFSKNWKNLKRLFALVDALIGLPEFMERIRHQVENDHDTNLRDEVTQILDLANDTASKVAELADRQERHERKSVATLQRLGAIEDHIKENR
ncbi:hypothetical protein [Microbacterium sp. 69-10]|uniref:hypothetical protein n=1 Tax=Microbacterium sp. 69-10 TaxID=1895783 RepID=UPI0025D6E0BE|nr:hypothetical protein [Microbacterium sp. 69-10]